MKRFLFASVLTVLSSAAAFAQQTAPPPTAPPPAGQTPPPLLPKPPGTQTPAPTPAPVAVPFPADSKIGFVNMQALLSESKLGKAGLAQMKVLTDKQQTDLSDKQKALQTLQQKIQTQSAVVTPETKNQWNSDLEKAQRDLQYFQNEAQAQVEELNQKLLGDFQEKVLPVIEALAKEKGLYAIFGAAESGAAYIHPGVDLTVELVKRLDAKFPGK
ncbi:MAG TPA: OmpH family outer membrane protein [Vicinamibacterales bacterium]|nr:OmpH family outer membrane protein [Vicinamibacterales bacterium]